MANAELSWSVLRPLRPVLLAGAAAMAWLAFSAPAANADPHDQPSLLGGITSTVSSVGNGGGKTAGNAAGGATAAHAPDFSAATPQPASLPAPQPTADTPAAVVSVPVPTPVAAVAETVLVPVVDEVTQPIDTVAGALPVADILPAGTVAAVTDPVVALADTAVADTAENVLLPVTETLPVDLPVRPISDLVPGIPSLVTPVVTPITDVLDTVASGQAVENRVPVLTVLGDVPVARTDDTSGGGTSGGTAYSPQVSLLAAASASAAPSTHPGRSGSSGLGENPGSTPALPVGGGSPAGGSTQLPEALLPASPSGSGSGQSSGGPAASAAWLSSPFEYLPITGIVPVSGSLQHIPSPVAIDPGSSPD